MLLKDVKPLIVVYTTERIGDEVREVYYIRDRDRPVRFVHNVPAARIGIAQGVPGEAPRYLRKRPISDPQRDPGEVDGRITVHNLEPLCNSNWDLFVIGSYGP